MGTGSSGYGISGTAGAGDAGYKGGTGSHHSIADNKDALTSKYPLRNGYFGSKGSSSSVDGSNRRIQSPRQLISTRRLPRAGSRSHLTTEKESNPRWRTAPRLR